jgi:short-subunit dehydrogenase
MSTTSRPLALVTGASSGTGYELASQFAGRGFDLASRVVPDVKAAQHRTMAEPSSANK